MNNQYYCTFSLVQEHALTSVFRSISCNGDGDDEQRPQQPLHRLRISANKHHLDEIFFYRWKTHNPFSGSTVLPRKGIVANKSKLLVFSRAVLLFGDGVLLTSAYVCSIWTCSEMIFGWPDKLAKKALVCPTG